METQMVQNPEQKKMVAPKAEAAKPQTPSKKDPNAKVRVYCLREFKVEQFEQDAQGKITQDNSFMAKPGEIIEVSRAFAKDLCKTITGAYAFSGERYNKDGDLKRHDLTRARPATKMDLMQAEAKKQGQQLDDPADQFADEFEV